MSEERKEIRRREAAPTGRRAAYYRVIAEPLSDGDAKSAKKRKTSVLAWSSRSAVALACVKMDIHPRNYGFSTDRLAEKRAWEDER